MAHLVSRLATVLGASVPCGADGFPFAFVGSDGTTCPACEPIREGLRRAGLTGFRVHCRKYNATVPNDRGARDGRPSRQHDGYKAAHIAAPPATADGAVAGVRVIPASWPSTWNNAAANAAWCIAVERAVILAEGSDDAPKAFAAEMARLLASMTGKPATTDGATASAPKGPREPTVKLHPVMGVHRALRHLEGAREALSDAAGFYGYTLAGPESVIAPHSKLYGAALATIGPCVEALRSLPADFMCDAPERAICEGDLYALTDDGAAEYALETGSELPEGFYRVTAITQGEYMIRRCFEDGTPVDNPHAARVSKADLGKRGVFKYLRTIAATENAPKPEAPKARAVYLMDGTPAMAAPSRSGNGWLAVWEAEGKVRNAPLATVEGLAPCDPSEVSERVRAIIAKRQ